MCWGNPKWSRLSHPDRFHRVRDFLLCDQTTLLKIEQSRSTPGEKRREQTLVGRELFECAIGVSWLLDLPNQALKSFQISGVNINH